MTMLTQKRAAAGNGSDHAAGPLSLLRDVAMFVAIGALFYAPWAFIFLR